MASPRAASARRRAPLTAALLAVLVAAGPLGVAGGDEDGEPLTFVRKTHSREGWRFIQSAALGEKVVRKFEHDGKIVKVEEGDWKTAYECEFEIVHMEGEQVREAKATFRSATLTDDQAAEHPLELEGKTVFIRGEPGKREFFFDDDKRPDERQVAFLRAHFDESGGERPDPRELFLPAAATPVGGDWKLEIEPIAVALGVPAKELVAGESRAGGHLDKAYEEHGERFADVTIDVELARSTLDGAPLKDGKVAWKGLFQLPVDGKIPYGALEHTMSFSGITVAYRGADKFVIHFEVERHGRVVATPVD